MATPLRDPMIDMVRGLALVMIFINHVPGNPLETLTSRNFGFSDATELFVFLAGYSAATAYGRAVERDGAVRTGLRVWGRAFRLYVLHLFTLLLASAIVAAASLWSGDPHFLEWINLGPLFSDPAATLVGVVLLGHQAGYFNILPLYVVLLLGTPLLLAGLRRWPGATVTAAAALYLGTQWTGINLPAFPGDGAWFFNPLAWQMMFVAGAWCGDRARRGLPVVESHPLVLGGAVLLLLVALAMKLGEYYPSPDDLPLPFFVYGQEKTFVTLPRLLHALALLYVGRHLARRFLGRPPGTVGLCLALIGRQGLAVFCLGSVLAIAAQAFLFITDAGAVLECAIIGLGIGLQLGLAWLISWHSGALAATAAAPRWRLRWLSSSR